MTDPAYLYRPTRSAGWTGRPGRMENAVDSVAVDRASTGERLPLNAAERREAVRRLRGLSSNEVARRLDLSHRTVQRHRAALRRERRDG